MRIGMILGLAAAAALSACGTASTPEPAANNEAAAPNEAVPDDANASDNGAVENYSAAVIALPPKQQNIVFIRAILDAGLKCEHVDSSERMEDQNGVPTWRATCSDGNSHIISITPDGTANVISRATR